MYVKSVIYPLFSAVSNYVCVNNESFILIHTEASLETDHLFYTENKKTTP